MDKYLKFMRSTFYKNTACSLAPVKYLIYAGVGALCALLLTVIFNVTGLVGMESYREVAATQFGMFDSGLMMVLLYCVFTPILEETVFRFVIYNSFVYAIKKDLLALVLSSALFGIYHMNPVQSLYAFIMGIVICLCYKRTENLFVPIAVHASANLVALAYTVFFL